MQQGRCSKSFEAGGKWVGKWSPGLHACIMTLALLALFIQYPYLVRNLIHISDSFSQASAFLFFLQDTLAEMTIVDHSVQMVMQNL